MNKAITIMRINNIKPDFVNIFAKKYQHMFANMEKSKHGHLYVQPIERFIPQLKHKTRYLEDHVTFFEHEKEFSRINIRYGTMDQF